MDKYEISLWEDYPDIINGNTFLNERKLCVIGSDTMRSGARAIEPKMINAIDGTNTFSFKMYKNYIDEITGESYKNPFSYLLVNERKVKVFWKDKWYDLVIKNINEDSTGKGDIYTCEDLFISELSKNGYNLSFSSELQNNIGTAAELAARVLEDSGWIFDIENSDLIIQQTEEAVYETNLIQTITATKQSPSGDSLQQIAAGQKILMFYSSVIDITNVELEDRDVQFLYSENGYITDENEMVVTNGDCYAATFSVKKNNQYIEFYQDGALKIKINTDDGISTNYRAERLVKSQRSAYDELLERYVNVYNDTQQEKEVYGYQTSIFTDPLAIVNLIVNPVDFKSLDGWIGEDLTFGVYPKFTRETAVENYIGKSYLKIPVGYTYNKAFSSNKQYLAPSQTDIKNGNLKGFQIGEKYIFRVKFKAYCDDPSLLSQPYLHDDTIQPLISLYDLNFNPVGNSYFSIESAQDNEDWREYTLICINPCASDEIENLGFFLNCSDICWIEEVQFFKYATGVTSYILTEEQRLNPGEISLQGIEKTIYRYYNIDHDGVEKVEELVFLYESEEDSNRFIPIYNNYEKMTAIEESQSNRFNILQSIAENFKCWVRFNINHNQAGRILVNDDGTQQKYVSIVNSIGKDLGWSFEYGIDLKAINRKIISNDLATKIIVSPNTNEVAKNGFCSIARSNLNYTKENFILNFDYYINQGLLDKAIVEQDLYSTSSEYIGYYYNLHQYNTEYDEITNILSEKQLELDKQQAQLKVLEEKNKATQNQKSEIQSQLMMLAGVTTWEEAEAYIQTHADATQIQVLMNSYTQIENSLADIQRQINELTNSITTLEIFINTKTARQEELINITKELHKQFFTKYSRFIQEGTWQEENYIDDDKYYLDAVEVAYTSSRPRLQYTIDIIRVNDLEDFSSKTFEVGDTCYVQDRQFFGYCADKITPYKLKIVISEITSLFDQPDKNTVKAQNYKTQFDDLFQRITASVQSLQYNEGSYQRAADVITTDKTIDFKALQETFDINQDFVLNSSNQQVTWDATGITVVDSTNTASKVKLMSGGLFITNDGGTTWRSAIRGDGISTNILTAGKINTREIYIYDGEAPSFRWDSNGLTAYNYDDNGINFNKFLRYDKYGIYGYDGNTDFIPNSEDDIWDNAAFGLTWKGFFLKSRNNNSSFEISSNNDLVIKTPGVYGEVNRLQIGRLNNSSTNYGFQLRDRYGNIIFVVDDNGARIGGMVIKANGLSDQSGNALLSMNEIRFEDVIINNNGIGIPDVEYFSINDTPCQLLQVPVISSGTSITANITWEDGGTQHTGTITFNWAGDSYNAICVE